MIEKLFKKQKLLIEASKVMKLPLSMRIVPKDFSQIQKFITSQEESKRSAENFKKGFINFKFLVSRGWYISIKVIDEFEISQLSDVYELTKEENLLEFEKYIISSFDDRKVSVFHYLEKTLSNRKHIIKEIEKLYENELFYSLIPLCYSQADGVSNEKWGFGFFDSDRNDSYNLKIKQLYTSSVALESLISHQLKQSKNELNLNSQDPKFNDASIKESSINRHLVIHGHSIHYGTKINSIRAILLLEFLCDLINESFEVKV